MLNFKNLISLCDTFKMEQDCVKYLIEVRYNGKITCPNKNCVANEFEDGSNKIYHFSDGKTFKCSCCKKRFSVRVGTIFEDSKIELRKWFMAIYLLTAHKKGISSCQLARDISITQKTAWFMLSRLRHASSIFATEQFTGTVEMDECYIGGKEGNKHIDKRFKNEKSVVFGMKERESGKTKTFAVQSAEYKILGQKVIDNVALGSNIMTDGFHSYDSLEKFYKRDVINHSVGEYVRIDKARQSVKIHTNGIEGYWSLVKRGINGIYHWVSKKHLQKYLNEFDFRFNSRFISDSSRFEYYLTNTSKKLSYKKLVRGVC
jgi:transposase-like protein